jgi:glycosyltransferase involved in cell wall biosynthesis
VSKKVMLKNTDDEISSKNLLISIVTPVLNDASYLEQTIQSVIAQDYDNIEYIIIDGGSTDGTIDIIKKYEDNIDFWVSESDKGIYDAQNKGVARAGGEYFAILNSGDYYASTDVISRVAECITDHPGVDYVYSNALLIKIMEGRRIVRFYSDMANIWKFTPVSHPTLFSRTGLFMGLGGFDLSYRVAADYDYMCKLYVDQTKGIKLDQFSVYVRQGGFSCLNKQSPKEMFLIQKHHHPSQTRTYVNYFSKIVHFYSLRWLIKIIGERNYNRIKPLRYLSKSRSSIKQE